MSSPFELAKINARFCWIQLTYLYPMQARRQYTDFLFWRFFGYWIARAIDIKMLPNSQKMCWPFLFTNTIVSLVPSLTYLKYIFIYSSKLTCIYTLCLKTYLIFVVRTHTHTPHVYSTRLLSALHHLLTASISNLLFIFCLPVHQLNIEESNETSKNWLWQTTSTL